MFSKVVVWKIEGLIFMIHLNIRIQANGLEFISFIVIFMDRYLKFS